MIKLYKRNWIWQYLPMDKPEKKEDYYLVNKDAGYYRVLSCSDENLRGKLELGGFSLNIPGETNKEIPLKRLPKNYVNNLTNLEYSQLKANDKE